VNRANRAIGVGSGVAMAVAVAVILAALAPIAGAQTAEGIPAKPVAPRQQVDASQLTALPKQTRFVEAEYPADAKARGVEADVVLLLDVSATGKVDAANVSVPADPPGFGFDEAAVAAALQFEFEPARRGDTPIAVQITYRYRFTLKRAEPAPAPAAPAEAAPAPAAPRAPSVVNLAGTLRERGTRKPVAGVVVTVYREGREGEAAEPQGFEATSDATGEFVFYDLPPGTWTVAVRSGGYHRFDTSETIGSDERVDVTYHLEKTSYNPYDVTVTAPRPRKEVSRTSISREQIDTVPGGAGDPLAVVQNFAGVARAPIAGEIIVRGSSPKDTQVYIDGATVPLLYHFGGLKSVLPMAFLEGIDFYPGNFSPMYGHATGGILDVRIKEVRPERVGGTVDMSVLDVGMTVEAPIGDKGGIAIGARRSHVDAVLPAVIPDDSDIDLVTAPRYYDGQILASYRPAPAHDLRAMVLASDDSLKLLFENPADIDPNFEGNSFSTRSSFYRAIGSYRYAPSARFDNLLRVSGGTNWEKVSAGQFLLDFDFTTLQLRDAMRYQIGKRWTLTGGLDVGYARVNGVVHADAQGPPREGDRSDGDFGDEQLEVTINGDDYWFPAAFAEADLEPVDGLKLFPGVRVDYFEQTGETRVQPRFTARWQLDPRVAVKAGVGRYDQTPQFVETNRTFGNPDVEAERSIHYSAGVEWKPFPWLTLDATGFYKDLSHLVSRTDALVMDGGMTRPLRYDNGGEGRVYGAELVARHELAHNLAGWIAYTVSRSERRDSGATEDRLFDYDQPHILTAVATYFLPGNWQVGARFRLVSGNPETPVIGSVFNATADRYDPVYGPTNSGRVDAFHQLDVRIDKRWVFEDWMFNLYLDVQNVYNQANPEATAYSYDYTEAKPVRSLPILPILGLRAEL